METSGVGIPESSLDFSFGFDNDNFSDRTLQLEIAQSDSTTEPRVKTIHINSLILAARSRFFHKLFSNGMQESGQKHVTLRIETSEEGSLMDLLKYVYSNNLPTTLDALLYLLVIADKFEVASCLRDCTQLLQSMPMTCESASFCLDLPSSLLMTPVVQPFIHVAKQVLVEHFKDFEECEEEILNLSLPCIQVLLSSDDLQVTSEIVVYDLVLSWVHEHYTDMEERREILKNHLLDLIRFPFMTLTELTEVQTCSDIYPELASDIVMRALYFKAETSHRKRCLAAEEGNAVSRQFVERAYKYRPVKVVELESPHHHCMVFLHITRQELINIFPSGEIMSETFPLGKHELAFDIECFFSKETNSHYFGLSLNVVGSTTPFLVKYEIGVRRKPLEKFVSWNEGSYVFTEQESGVYVVSQLLWSDLLKDGNVHFINDVLHVRAELTTEK